MGVVGREQLGGADRRLAKRKPAVVGGHIRMREHGESGRAQPIHHRFEQNAILKTAARQRDDGKSRRRRAGQPIVVATSASVNPRWKRSAILAISTPAARSFKSAFHIGAGSICISPFGTGEIPNGYGVLSSPAAERAVCAAVSKRIAASPS